MTRSGKLLADLPEQECSHTRASPTSERVAQLETLEAIAALRLLPHHIQNEVGEFSVLGVVTFDPMLTGPLCAKTTCLAPRGLSLIPGLRFMSAARGKHLPPVASL